MAIIEGLNKFCGDTMRSLERKPEKYRLVGDALEWIFKRWLGKMPSGFPIAPQEIKKILVMRQDLLGDMIVYTPCFELLRKLLPHAQIDVWASDRNAVILGNNPRVNTVYSVSTKALDFIRQIMRARKQKYDTVLEASFNSRLFEGMVAHCIAPGAKIVQDYNGSATRVYRWLYNILIAVEQKTMPLYFYEVISRLFNHPIVPDDIKLRIYLDQPVRASAQTFLYSREIKKDFIVINLSGRQSHKVWGLPASADFLRLLRTSHPQTPVVCVASPDDYSRAETLVRALKDPQTHLYPKAEDYL
ncbi:MAG: hypothetical protein PHC61_18420, partial [Chitinivibrionales bacterium]|nr:hypothetical protein [Chitinivibrionales bacterium]